MDIFAELEPFYVSSKCKCKALPELITLCGGKLTNNRRRAGYIIGECGKNSFEGKCVLPNWILDSISEARLRNYQQYIIKMERTNLNAENAIENCENVII